VDLQAVFNTRPIASAFEIRDLTAIITEGANLPVALSLPISLNFGQKHKRVLLWLRQRPERLEAPWWYVDCWLASHFGRRTA
jgi:hypothetical protein